MVYFITAFNKEYVPYLQVLLQSIDDVYPTSKPEVKILYGNMDKVHIQAMHDRFPYVSFEEVTINFTEPLHQLAARKLHFWYKHVQGCDGPCNIAFLDCDMLLLRPLDHLFEDTFDVGYTCKTDQDEGLNYPLNTGAILVKNCNTDVDGFFRFWLYRTEEILNDPTMHAEARSKWGAADQAALAHLIGESAIRVPLINFTVNINKVTFKKFDCKTLNETRCRIGPETHVLHYKSGWRTVLTSGQYTKNRPQELCNEMYDLWHKTLARFKQQ